MSFGTRVYACMYVYDICLEKQTYIYRNKLENDWFSRMLREVGRAAVSLNFGYIVTQVASRCMRLYVK